MKLTELGLDARQIRKVKKVEHWLIEDTRLYRVWEIIRWYEESGWKFLRCCNERNPGEEGVLDVWVERA